MSIHASRYLNTHGRACNRVPGAARDSPRSAGPKISLSVTLPERLVGELEELVKDTGYWLSVVDFIREGTVEKLERWKKEHPPRE